MFCRIKRDTEKSSPPSEKAFTLVDLVVIIAVITMLSVMLMAVFAEFRVHVRAKSCLNNLQQLQRAWQLYVNDHQGLVPPNRSEFSDVWRSTPDSWVGGSSAVYDLGSKAIENSLLFKYTSSHSAAVYRCPSDQSRVRPISGMEMGPLRSRSYSMSGCLGGRTNEVQKTVDRVSSIRSPSALFVFIDENEASIDDGHFLTWPQPDTRWVNMPADRHDQSGMLSFADGHVERWRWLWPKSFTERKTYWKEADNEHDLADLRRLQNAIFRMEDFVSQK